MLFRKYIQVIVIGLFSFWSYIGPANAEFEWLFPWTSTAYDTLHEAEQVLMSYPGNTWSEYHEYMFSERIDAYSNKVRRQYGLLEWEPLSSHSIYGYAFNAIGRSECLNGPHCSASEAEAFQYAGDWYSASVPTPLCREEYSSLLTYPPNPEPIVYSSLPVPAGWDYVFIPSKRADLKLWYENENGDCPGLSNPYTEGRGLMNKILVGNCPSGFEVANPPFVVNSLMGLFYPDFPNVCSPYGNNVPTPGMWIIRRLTSVCTPTEGNPCSPMTGNKSIYETDYAGSNLSIERTYLSNSQYNTSVFGNGWNHNYSQRIEEGREFTYIQSNGTIELFRSLGDGQYRSKINPGTVLSIRDVGAEITFKGGRKEAFEKISGTGGALDQYRLIEVYESNAQATPISLSYDPTSGLLTQITDPQGRQFQLNYADGIRISSINFPDGNSTAYSYDADSNLETVTYQDLSTRTYLYEESALPGHITGIIDENGARYASYAYAADGRVTSSEHAGGAGKVSLSYLSNGITEVTTPLNDVKTFNYDFDALAFDVDAISDSNGSNLYIRNSDGWITQKTDPNGNITTQTYDDYHLISKTEAVGTQEERVIETDWENTINRVLETRRPGQTTSYTYNSRGQILTKSITDTATLNTRVWTNTYYENLSILELIGQIQSKDGPRTDVSDITTYNYYTTDDSGGMFLKGDLHTIADALGHVTEYLEYDGNGRPSRIMDANNVITTMGYHTRGWISNRTVNGKTTSFTYDNVGNLTRVMQPDGSFTDYEYDDAHRLNAIVDNFNNRIEYTLDAAGNRTSGKTYNDSGVLRREMGRVYDQLSRLQKIIDGNLDETTYGYDNNGNLTNSRDSNLNSTSSEYDPLDRLVKTIDATLGDTLIGYDERDNLNTVTDPLGNTTAYSYDGLNNQTQLVSPDTGITSYEYDAAGNRAVLTDARGVRVDYSYDVLNRLTFVDYTDNSLDITFGYDVGINGQGRLTSMDDAAGAESYTYDARGNLITVARDISGANYTTSYTYNGADRLIQITYPSGMVVNYRLDAAGRAIAVDKTIDSVTENLVTGVVYEPFGPVSNFTYGNGLTMSAIFDQDYELASLQSGALDWVFGYDDTGNILTIVDQVTPANNQIFTYDNLYRLNTASGGYGNENFDYDAIGNRTRYISNMVDVPYTYGPQSSRMTTQNGWTFSHDGVGNRTQKLDGSGYGQLYSYGDHNHLSMVSDRDAQGDTVVGTYIHDGRSQRVSKTVGSVTTHFIYGLNGKLLGEFVVGSTSDDVEYIYLNGQPIAVISSFWNRSPQVISSIYDNGDSETSSNGTWALKTDAQTYGPDQQQGRKGRKKAASWYRWETLLAPSTVEVYVRWVDHDSYSSQAHYAINIGSAFTDAVVKSHKTGGGQWTYLSGAFNDGLGPISVELSTAKGNVSADAIRIDRIFPPKPPILTKIVGYIHTDHLGTPRAVSDDTQTAIWRWDSTPFGEAFPNEDPDGDGKIYTLNLRFPGQRIDVESGFHYNYFRTYDPSQGRDVQSDPIGFQGGLNTYAYVGSNPLMYTDPLGLRASYCQRPLGDYSGLNGAGPPVLNHQFVCVTLANGAVRCDSSSNPDSDTNPFTPAPGVPSLPSRDNESIAQCDNIDDDKDRCFEDCVVDQWSNPRPNYAIGPLGTDCQEYSKDIVQTCRAQCP